LTPAEQKEYIIKNNTKDIDLKGDELKQLLKQEKRDTEMFRNIIYEENNDELDREIEEQIK
jgi:hypothetical protein